MKLLCERKRRKTDNLKNLGWWGICKVLYTNLLDIEQWKQFVSRPTSFFRTTSFVKNVFLPESNWTDTHYIFHVESKSEIGFGTEVLVSKIQPHEVLLIFFHQSNLTLFLSKRPFLRNRVTSHETKKMERIYYCSIIFGSRVIEFIKEKRPFRFSHNFSPTW